MPNAVRRPALGLAVAAVLAAVAVPAAAGFGVPGLPGRSPAPTATATAASAASPTAPATSAPAAPAPDAVVPKPPAPEPASPPTPAPEATPSGPPADYGSGPASDWRAQASAISTDEQFAEAPVWVFGDSIVRADRSDLAVQLLERTGLTLAVDAWAGRPTAPAVDAALARLAAHGAPDVLVMATGTNDIVDPTVMAAQVDRLMAAVPPTTPVLWVDVYAARWSVDAATREAGQRNAAWVNAQVVAATSRYPNLTVVSWFEALAANPGHRISRWLSDGVHTTEAGRVARNALVVAAVEDALGRRGAASRP